MSVVTINLQPLFDESCEIHRDQYRLFLDIDKDKTAHTASASKVKVARCACSTGAAM